MKALLCRLFGKACTVKIPSTRDLMRRADDRSRKVEAETVEMKLERIRTMEDAFFTGPGPGRDQKRA